MSNNPQFNGYYSSLVSDIRSSGSSKTKSSSESSRLDTKTKEISFKVKSLSTGKVYKVCSVQAFEPLGADVAGIAPTQFLIYANEKWIWADARNYSLYEPE